MVTEFMVSSMDASIAKGNISGGFVALIMFLIVGNVVQHPTSIKVVCKGTVVLAIGVAVESSTQIAVLVLPFDVSL